MKVVFICLLLLKSTCLQGQEVDSRSIWGDFLQTFLGGNNDKDDLQTVNFTFYSTKQTGWYWDFKFGEDPQNLLDNGFDPTKPTKFLAHGWTRNGTDFCPGFLQAYNSIANDRGFWDWFGLGDDDNDQDDKKTEVQNDAFNVICIDWKILANEGYIASAQNALKIGKAIGEQIVKNMLINHFGQDPSLIHVIGHSLGAHMAGQIGQETQKRSLQKIGRITALDPASPYFEGTSKMLSKNHAELVDVIHTNGGKLVDGDVAIAEPIGTVDFYPNGGEHQPGCEKDDMISTTSCHHQKGRFYYEDSIKHSRDPKYFQSTFL